MSLVGAISSVTSRFTNNINTGKLRVSELFFDVPVDYSKPADGSIRLFARSASHALAQTEKDDRQLPWFVYLTGGPGFGCQQPQDYGWVRKVLDKGYQVCDSVSI
jgi:hypothetical protein